MVESVAAVLCLCRCVRSPPRLGGFRIPSSDLLAFPTRESGGDSDCGSSLHRPLWTLIFVWAIFLPINNLLEIMWVKDLIDPFGPFRSVKIVIHTRALATSQSTGPLLTLGFRGDLWQGCRWQSARSLRAPSEEEVRFRPVLSGPCVSGGGGRIGG